MLARARLLLAVVCSCWLLSVFVPVCVCDSIILARALEAVARDGTPLAAAGHVDLRRLVPSRAVSA